MAEDWESGGFGLYIHWPYCAAKCPYCDFNSHVARVIDHDAWRKAYVEEIQRAGGETPGRILRSVFFGGGTPSLMEPKTVQTVLNEVHKTWPVANDLEVTLEANPTSVEAGKFTAFRSAGINRVSMGIQALNDTDLRALGRLHTVADGLAAFEIARRCFDRVSIDLMYGRQNQTLQQWEVELRQALSLSVDHISLYQLTVEPNTAFGDRYKAGTLRGLPNDDVSADMYDVTQALCADAGMDRYEVSNHAVDGAESVHNLIYWRYGDYIGIGPGAHGRLTLHNARVATSQVPMPHAWLSGSNRETREHLSKDETATEFLLMGLRLREGIDLKRYASLSNRSLNKDAIRELQAQDLIHVEKERLRVRNHGFIVLNEILRQLLS